MRIFDPPQISVRVISTVLVSGFLLLLPPTAPGGQNDHPRGRVPPGSPALSSVSTCESKAAILYSETRATNAADREDNALGIRATPDGALLRCGFQRLEGHVTTEGLCLESTEPGAGGKLRLRADALYRATPTASNSQLSTLNSQLPTFPSTGIGRISGFSGVMAVVKDRSGDCGVGERWLVRG